MARAAIIVAGGAGARLGGLAKPWLRVAGRPILEWVVASARRVSRDIIVVGTAPEGAAPLHEVLWTVEQPAGSGPANAIRAGVACLADDVDEVLVLAGDAPFVDAALAALCSVVELGDGTAAEVDGVVQFLLARLHRGALTRALDAGGDSMRSVFDHLQIETLISDVRDADTWEDVAQLRAGREASSMAENAWLDEAAGMLGIDPIIDVDAVLDLARDVAHSIERKNAPLTSYLLGYAAAARGLTPAQIAEAAAEVGKRAREHGANG